MKIDHYRAGDEEQIVRLFNHIFNRARDIPFWNWENKENPRGESLITVLRDDGEIRGQLCLQATLLKVGDKDLTAGQRIASMLDEAYRGTEAFGELFRYLVQQAMGRDWPLIIGFPNPPSLQALQKIRSAVAVAEIPRFVKFFSGFQAARAACANPLLAKGLGLLLHGPLRLRNRKQAMDPFVRSLDHFDTRFDRLWQQLKVKLSVATVRDSAYLNWRYIQSPTNYHVFVRERYGEIRGYLVLLQEATLVHIVDMLVLQPEQDLPPLLAQADAFARACGLPLSCWCLDRGEVSSVLCRHGFFRLKSENRLVLTDICCPEPLLRILSQGSNWYVTMGDSDYV